MAVAEDLGGYREVVADLALDRPAAAVDLRLDVLDGDRAALQAGGEAGSWPAPAAPAPGDALSGKALFGDAGGIAEVWLPLVITVDIPSLPALALADQALA